MTSKMFVSSVKIFEISQKAKNKLIFQPVKVDCLWSSLKDIYILLKFKKPQYFTGTHTE